MSERPQELRLEQTMFFLARLAVAFLIGLGLGLGLPPAAQAHELSGNVKAETRGFAQSGQYSGQGRASLSLAVRPEYYHEWDFGLSVTAAPFARLDSTDSRRTHWDIRELNLLWVTDYWELRVGGL